MERKTDPLLEEIAKIVTQENPNWCGTATELKEKLSTDLSAISLAMKLNICSGKLANEYNIRYERVRTHDGRLIKLTFMNSSS